MASNVSQVPYFPTGVYKQCMRYSFEGRQVIKFIREDNQNNSLKEAVKAIRRLITTFNLCPTFTVETDDKIESEIKDKNYLVINDRALCVSVARHAPGDAPSEYKDIYFSGCLLKLPVECTRGHVLEKQFAEFWGKSNNHLCPVGNDHGLGELTIKELLQIDIQAYGDEKKQIVEKFESFEQIQDIQKIIKFKKDYELNAFKEETADRNIQAIAKWLIKCGGTQIARIVRTGGKAITIVAVVSIVLGIYSCVRRLQQAKTFSDKMKAVGELISAACCLIPVAGFIASICIDALLAFHDNKSLNNFSIDMKALKFNSPEIFKILGLPENSSQNHSLETIKFRYQSLTLACHPDKMNQLKEMLGEEDLKELVQIVNQVKEHVDTYRDTNSSTIV